MLARTMENILIVGAGLTGACTAAMLSKEWSNARLAVWEKSRGVGGSTRLNWFLCLVNMIDH